MTKRVKGDSEIILERIVHRLKALRQNRGISHADLAAKAKITRPAVSLIESGKRNPSLAVALKLAAALGEKLSDIVRAAEKNEHPK